MEAPTGATVITQDRQCDIMRENITREIGLRITVLARMMRNHFDRHVGDIGITRSQWALIAAVARHPGSTQRHIAEMLEMSEVSAGRLIDRLVADGTLERREREDDRRARAIYLTANANPLLERMSAFARAWEKRIFGGIGEEDLETLDRLLGVVYSNCCAISETH